MKSLLRFITDSDYRFIHLMKFGYYNKLSDEEFLKRIYHAFMNRNLDLANPQTFTEKIQWLKLYDRKPIYKNMVDKFEAKKYVANIIGSDYIIPTLGVWDSFEDIDFNLLPNQFVLKCTHDSGGVVICKDKNEFDYKNAKKKISRSLKSNYFWNTREWPYKNIVPRIIAEVYLEDSATKELRDYKFFAFNGNVKAMFIATERQSIGEDTKFDFFDINFNHLDVRNGHPNALIPPSKPKCFDEMKQLAAKLSIGIPHIRVDFYEVDGKVYFGELTFSHWSGLIPFDPPEWDKKFGEWIKLPL